MDVGESCFVPQYGDESFPKETKDGKWIIGYDEKWDPVIVDDISDLDPLTRDSLPLQQENCDLKIFADNKANAGDCSTLFSCEEKPNEFENVAIPLPYFELNSSKSNCDNNPSLSDCLWDYDEVSEEVTRGIVGLTNLGNTCFINSGLQCLFNNWRLVEYFLEMPNTSAKSCDNDNTDNSLSNCFIELMRQVWSKERKMKTIKSLQFKESLAKIFPQFKDYRQHDCQEFLALLLSALHEELKVDEELKSNVSSPLSSSSISSSCSSSDVNQNEDEIRRQPIPEEIQSFNNIIPLLEKETKTLNTNVSKIDDESNNKLTFNSFKFPRTPRKGNLVVDNLRGEEAGNFSGNKWLENNDNVCKKNAEIRDFLSKSRSDSKPNEYEQEASGSNARQWSGDECGKEGEELKGLKRLKDTNVKNNTNQEDRDIAKRQKVNEFDEGITEWKEYLGFNKKSIIVDTFQGQFKSTIKCSNCCHVSVTFEPFMYLALPLPHALQQQITVTFVDSSKFSYCSREDAFKTCVLDVHKYDNVAKLIQLIADQTQTSSNQLCLTVLQDNYIVKILDPLTLVRNIDFNSSLCAFSLNASPPPPPPPSSSTAASSNENDTRALTCSICLEDKVSSDLLIHEVSCNCTLCYHCLDMLVSHYCKDKSTFSCPICTVSLTKDDYYAFDLSPTRHNSGTSAANNNHSLIMVPLLFRVCQSDDWEKYKLISYPLMLQLINVINGAQLYELVDRLVPYPCPYSLHLVDRKVSFECGDFFCRCIKFHSKGQQCSRCFNSSACGGCEISRYGQVILNCEDTIALQFDTSFDLSSYPSENVIENKPMSMSKECLTLNDCLNAFSQTETLDDDNPWFCPNCTSNQRARKSLSIWRCPDTLMVYLKRFVFHEMQSIKVDDPVSFPINSLDLSPFIKGPKDDHIYHLQSLICHSGGVNSGHYTSFAKHSSGDWYYFNDEIVSKQEPDGKDERAYILFYQRPSKFLSIIWLMCNCNFFRREATESERM
ncbi:ubiquitin carboxyl-terminal hydrolase 6-like isoform X2 [Dinothrombium tinctorium]|uniref:Ubiquitin carboxyl-terminal hydrolase n=1 Tax=Dinothrombium tinctorium TaxID=1965070 RepID=A0A443RDB3_9ACAR|nr:ubiquitin carboxyl-terminal hydrolase 6-like isoform X2 [Dinothrombium tinctorium]